MKLKHIILLTVAILCPLVRAGVPEPTLANSADVALAEANAAADATAKADAAQAASIQRANHTGTQAWGTITATPTTLSGYGISDAVASSLLSQNGGTSKVLQTDSSGNLRFSGSAATGTAASVGGVFFQDTQRLWFLNTARSDGGSLFYNTAHDQFGGELQINSPHRIALCLGVNGAIQLGLSLTDSKQYVYLQRRGSATAGIPSTSSIPLFFTGGVWNGSSETVVDARMQAVPLGTAGEMLVNISCNAVKPNEAGGDGTTRTDATFSSEGLWTPGQAPAHTTLTDGATITQTCSIYKTVQNAKVTLGGNRTLVISGAVAGMRGVIYVAQDATGSRTLTLPTGSATATDWALSTIGSRIDRLNWEYDGTIYYWSMAKGIEIAADSDASAFFTAASITDPTQRSAVNNLVIALKTNSLWTKIYALYPFVGGNATAHSKDLKGAYNITWNGSPTHDSNGVTGNGTDAWGNTGFTYSAVSALNSASMYVYSKTTTPTDARYFIGAVSTSPSTSRWGILRSGANVADGGVQTVAPGYFTVSASTDSRKHLAINRSSSTDIQAYVNSTASNRTDGPVGLACSQPVGILARNFVGSGADNFSNANLGMVMLGQSLTSGEWTIFRGIVDTYQATLSRANP